MKPPFGLERNDEHGNPLVWKLEKSLYGLRQAGHNWMRDLFAFLREYGLEQSPCDTSLWFLRDATGSNSLDLILFVHTDDGKLAGRTQEINDKFMTALKQKFNVGTHMHRYGQHYCTKSAIQSHARYQHEAH